MEKSISSLPKMDVVLDMAGGDFLSYYLQLANDDARICTIALVRGSKTTLNYAHVLMKRLTLTASTLRAQNEQSKQKMANAIRENLWAGVISSQIKPHIDRSFLFTEANQALVYMEKNQHKGKIVLTL